MLKEVKALSPQITIAIHVRNLGCSCRNMGKNWIYIGNWPPEGRTPQKMPAL